MQIYFLAPDHHVPSWGMGMIYHMAEISNQLGINASILSLSNNAEMPRWLEVSVRLSTLTAARESIRQDDILIVPEVMVTEAAILDLQIRKIVFIQGSVMIPIGLKSYDDYQALGFTNAIAVLPHISLVVQRFWPIEIAVVAPFVADYFFADVDKLDLGGRRRQILLFPKPGYKEAGYFDYEIVLSLLNKKLIEINAQLPNPATHWNLVEIRGRSHKEVAGLMQESCFFVNTNCFESFNTTVPEAMAAGCITFCYEAFGGQDFLLHEENAFVFRNNYVYTLLDRLVSTLIDFENLSEALRQIQQNGISTAKKYVRTRTKMELSLFYKGVGVEHKEDN